MRHIYAGFIAGLVLLGQPPAAQAEFVNISDDLKIYYETAGNGTTPIVMVPGWTMSSAVFEKQLKHFSASDKYKVYAYDPRGQGLSSKTVEGHYYAQHGRDLKVFMDKLNLKGVVLAGWSYAALDVTAYVHQFGHDNLRALVLIDGTPRSSGADETKEWVWYRTDDANGYRKSFTMPILEDRQTANKGFAEWMVENPGPEYMKWMLAIMNQTSDTVAALLNETGAYEDYSADLKALNGKLPMLYVVRQDWAKATADWAGTNTPAAMVKVFPKHLSFWERSDEFNQNLDEFLATVK